MKVAVVGSGVSGLAATYLLNEFSPHQVHLFEAAERPGGHTNTVSYSAKGKGKAIQVDTGFIVMNPITYPNFLRFLRREGIQLIDSAMSFSVSRDRGEYEWAGTSLSALFAQWKNLFSLDQWLLVWDILRFNTFATDYLQEPLNKSESIQTYLDRNRYSQSFRDNYLLPMTAAVWSTPPDDASLNFPAATLIRFMHNHHLLQIADRPVWLTIKNGSKTYVDRILSKLPSEQLRLNSPVISLERQGEKVRLRLKDKEEEFDHVILACHADTSLQILKEDGSGLEKEILGHFEFGKNVAVLHSDIQLMPRRRTCWAAWNYLTATDAKSGRANVNKVALTYWMNLLQDISEKDNGPVLVTLNPPFEPDRAKTFASYQYEHLYMSQASVAAQSRLPEIQHKNGLSFAGAWTKYGFHEDGFTSGLRAALSLPGVAAPFEVTPAERPLLHQSSLTKILLECLQQLFVFLGLLKSLFVVDHTRSKVQ